MFCFGLGLKYRQSNIGHADLLPHAWWFLCPWFCFSLPQTVLAFRYLWLSRFLRLKQSGARSNLSPPLCLPSLRPFVSPLPLSPLLSLSSCLQLLLGLVSSSAPPLKALEFYCSEKNVTACGYQRVIWFRTSFGPRSHLVRTSEKKMQPIKTQPGRFWKSFAMVCCLVCCCCCCLCCCFWISPLWPSVCQ